MDLTQFITGDTISRVSGRLRTFVDERPLPSEHSGLSGTAGTGTGKVTVDDAATFLADFSGGAMGVFEATRFASGRKNAIRIEVNGSQGSIAFDFEDMNVLQFFDGTEPAEVAGFRRIIVTEPEHSWHMKLMLREVIQPTQACTELVQDFIRPHFEMLDQILAEILPAGFPAQNRRLIGFSIIGQCLHFRVAQPVISLLVGPQEHAAYTPQVLTEHITRFSLAALGVAPSSDLGKVQP